MEILNRIPAHKPPNSNPTDHFFFLSQRKKHIHLKKIIWHLQIITGMQIKPYGI